MTDRVASPVRSIDESPAHVGHAHSANVVMRLLEQRVTGMVLDYGAMEVETPIMYDYGRPARSKYLHRFPARQYVVRSEEKEYFLRFAACFGQYMIQHDMVTSHHDLPVRLYELTHFSFRREQGGEVSGQRPVTPKIRKRRCAACAALPSPCRVLTRCLAAPRR